VLVNLALSINMGSLEDRGNDARSKNLSRAKGLYETLCRILHQDESEDPCVGLLMIVANNLGEVHRSIDEIERAPNRCHVFRVSRPPKRRIWSLQIDTGRVPSQRFLPYIIRRLRKRSMNAAVAQYYYCKL
jgi:hypothetical protein